MKQSLTFTFVNPNSPAEFEEALKKILLDKLLAEFACPDSSATRTGHPCQ